jgi:NAD+ kinase
MLMVARRYLDWNIPILGVKGGRLGFLTEPPSAETVARIKSGAYLIQERMRITAVVEENGNVIKEFSALNDVVVHVAGSSRIVGLRTNVDSNLIREYFADGVIVATPTGSTAYSLSAGGPVVMPTVRAIMMTPLAPHTLSVRPLVIDADGTVRIDVLSANTEMRITVDGQKGMDLEQGQHVTVRRSKAVTRLVVPEHYDFFTLLREKL